MGVAQYDGCGIITTNCSSSTVYCTRRTIMASLLPTDSEKGHFDVRTICKELGGVKHKFFEIGVQLGIPRNKLMEFKKDDDPLSAIIDYWLSGNVEGVPLSWQFIVEALGSGHVGEIGLAKEIIKKYNQSCDESSSNYPPSISMASLTVTSSGSNSSGQLSVEDYKDFPYLTPGEMDEDELSSFLGRLKDDTRKIKAEFSVLLYHLQRDIEATAKLEDVVPLLLFNIEDTGFKELMGSCKSLSDVFRHLFKFISFFDFYLVKLLTRIFGSTSTKKRLKKYKKKFHGYCKRRICECPKDVFGKADKSDKIYKIKTDKILESYTLEKLDELQHEIRKILGLKLLRLLKIKDGCIRLTFRVVNDDHLVICEEQKLALRNLGVLSVTYGSKIVIISSSSVPEKASDIISDSGFHSKSITETSTEKSYSTITGGKDNRKITTKSSELFSFAKEKDLIDPRIDMLTSASTERTKLLLFSPLYIATQQGNLQVLKQLIEKGDNPLDKDINDDTLLHFAAAVGKLDILKYLVEDVGCNPATEGFQGSTTLHVAANCGWLHIVKYLIEQCQLDPTAFDSIKWSPLVYACASGSLDIVRYLVKCMQDYAKLEDVFNSSYESIRDNAISSPLCSACFRGHLTVIKYLIEECDCDPSQSEDGKFITPVSAAVSGNQLIVLKYLTITKQVTFDKEEILIYSVSNRNLELVKFLIQSLHCDPNAKNKDDISSLYAAASCGCLKIVKYLISLKCDPFIKSDQGRLPIHAAAGRGQLDVVKFLIEKPLYSPSVLDEEMNTPLFLACVNGHLPVIRYLTLEHHCNPLRVCSNERTSLHSAALGEHIDVVRYFVKELKCDPNTKISGIPVFHSAIADSGDVETVNILINELGFDPLIRNDEQRTAVHITAIVGNLPMMRYLVEDKKCDPNVTDIYGKTPLLVSAENGQLHVLQYLINELNIDKNSFNSKTLVTTLGAAAIGGSLQVLKYLLEIGCDLSTKQRLTPLHHAANNDRIEIVRYLMTTHPDMYSIHPFITPLHLATLNGDLIMVKYFLEEAHCSSMHVVDSRVAFMIASQEMMNTSVRLVCFMKCDSLLLACHGGYLEILKVLAQFSADPNASSTITGDRPIHVAAQSGHLNVVKYLVEELKCVVNSVSTNYLFTPLHYAAYHGHLDIVQYLVEKKADIACCDKRGDTPLHTAAIGDQLQVVKFLMSKNTSKSVDFKMTRTPLQASLQTSEGKLSLTTLYLIVTEFNSLK